MRGFEVALYGGSSAAASIKPVPRAPLAPFHEPVDYPTTLPFTPPPLPTLEFYRGSMGLYLANAPVAPGGNDRYPGHVMTCLLDNYPVEWQDRFLLQFAQNGYTHLQRSLGHALFYGHTLDSYVALSRKAQNYGLFCDHWLMGGGEGDDWAFKARDQDASYWGPLLKPYVDRIVGAGVMDHACVGWQLDQFNVPGNPILSNIKVIAEMLPQSVPLFTHWVNEALAWWRTGGEVWADQYQTINVTDRFTFWAACQPYLSGGHHQGSNIMALTNPKLYQDKLLDTLDPFGGDTGKGNMGQSIRGGVLQNFRLTLYEVTEQFRFNGVTTDEQGDLATRSIICAKSHTGATLGGYGDGGRQTDGSFL